MILLLEGNASHVNSIATIDLAVSYDITMQASVSGTSETVDGMNALSGIAALLS